MLFASIFILSTFVSVLTGCQKEKEVDQAISSIDTSYGGGATACSFPELKTNGLPTLTWILEGTQQQYQPYSSNQYYRFGSAWLPNANYLCNGNRRVHNGWDIHCPNFSQISGKKVYAAFAGKVQVVYNAGSGFKQGITIEHTDLNGDIFTTNYTHVDPLMNMQGQTVIAGQQIGTVADLVENDHLHFSLRRAPYSDYANRGALPKYMDDNNCSCSGDPVFPEYFVNPGSLVFQPQSPTAQSRIISLSSSSLTFGNVIIGNSPVKPLEITNNGNSLLTVSSISLPTGYNSDYNSGSIPAGNSIIANVTFRPQNAVSLYNGTITVNSNATSGVNTVAVSGSGVNGTSSAPAFSPPLTNPTGCGFGNQTGAGGCTGNTYLGGTIRLRAANYNSSTNTITFNVEKCIGSFSNSGTAYIKQGDYCGSVVGQKSYSSGVSSVSIVVTPPIAAGHYTYTAVIISATTDRFYSLSIDVQY